MRLSAIVCERTRTPVRSAALAATLTGLVMYALPVGAIGTASAATPAPTPATTPVPSSFTLDGAGWGHGVGLSQYGALGMAREGKTATEILTHYFTGTQVAQFNDKVNIRVNIQHRVPYVSFRSESLGVGGGGIQVALTGGLSVVGTPTDVFRVDRVGNVLRLSRRTPNGVTTVIGASWGITIRWAGTPSQGPLGSGPTGTGPTVVNIAKPGGSFTSAGHRYRYGVIDAAVVAGTVPALGFEVVNRVGLHDDYLRGLGEMSSSWPAAALQAQVIAARSYALARYGTGKVSQSCRCHIDSGHGPFWDQAFVGWSKEKAVGGGLWRAAVTVTNATATTGAVILYRGKPVKAFYSAATGGRTQNSEDAWGGVLPWARSVDDHWSLDPKINPGWSAWNPRVRTQAQVAAAFRLPNVVKLQVTSRYVSTAVRTITAWSSAGTRVVITGGQIASRLGLPSSYLKNVTAVLS